MLNIANWQLCQKLSGSYIKKDLIKPHNALIINCSLISTPQPLSLFLLFSTFRSGYEPAGSANVCYFYELIAGNY